MILKNKKLLVITSLLTLLPTLIGLLLWNKLPETMITHFGFDGQPDGWSDVTTAVFVLPLILLFFHWVCVLADLKFSGNSQQNPKLRTLVLWIIPILSNLCCGMMYALTLGADFSVTNIMFAFMGLMFIFIGNYLPKCKMNATMGIKIYWTYTSEENWNATHRFGGKLWFIGGIVMLFTVFLPVKYAIIACLIITAVMVILPVIYSQRYYHKQLAQGCELKKPLANAKATKVSSVAAAIILILVSVLMFSGNIQIVYGEESFTIDASFSTDMTIRYDAIDAIELREGNVEGYRIMGFASAKLLMGTFENDEFGYYTRYTYTHSESCIVLTSGDKVLVLGGKDAQETQSIYQNLLVLTETE